MGDNRWEARRLSHQRFTFKLYTMPKKISDIAIGKVPAFAKRVSLY